MSVNTSHKEQCLFLSFTHMLHPLAIPPPCLPIVSFSIYPNLSNLRVFPHKFKIYLWSFSFTGDLFVLLSPAYLPYLPLKLLFCKLGWVRHNLSTSPHNGIFIVPYILTLSASDSKAGNWQYRNEYNFLGGQNRVRHASVWKPGSTSTMRKVK